jgi:hypothetical protein
MTQTPEDGEKPVGSPPMRPGMRPGLNGGWLRDGSTPGTNKGGSGRPPNGWKTFCHEVLTDPRVQARILRAALRGDPGIIRLLAEHANGAPDQHIAIDGDTGALDRLLEALKK